MKETTRKWLEDLATIKNNSKAIEIVNHLNALETDYWALSSQLKEAREEIVSIKCGDVDVSDIGLIGL